jgi:hypothetical protein
MDGSAAGPDLRQKDQVQHAVYTGLAYFTGRAMTACALKYKKLFHPNKTVEQVLRFCICFFKKKDKD